MTQESVCAVIVTYNPGKDLLRNLAMLTPQVGTVVIVDNGSSGPAAATIREAEEQTSCAVLRNDRNLGIASALNCGFRYAIDKQYEWILTFDQDSTVTEGFTRGLLEMATTAAAPGIVCPTYVDRESMNEMVMPKLISGDLLTAMTSGSMFHRSTYAKAGPFDERLYIDSVDNEYCLRIRSLGMRILQSREAVLLHSLGKMTYRNVLGKRLVATNHRPARRYYMTRNRLFLLSRYRRDRDWVRFQARDAFGELISILLVESHKLAKIGYMIRGVFDFTRGKWGPQVPL